MRHRDLISVIEALYRVDLAEPQWVEGVLEAAHASMDCGLGTAAYLYDATRVPVRVWNARVLDSVMPVEALVATVAGLEESYVQSVARRLFVGTASEGLGFRAQHGVIEQANPRGVGDAQVVNAYDPSGVGVYIGSLLPRITKLGARRRRALERIGAHMACGLGLRLRLGTSRVEAVLTTRGRVEHAEADAKANDARAALRDAAIAMERARGAARHEESAVEMWRARVFARWTLVDQFESDGKRFLVARANELPSKGLDPLTHREEQLLFLLASGRSSKVVAYELGIAPSTVRVLLRRAAKKLGAGTTAHAVEIYRRLRTD